MEFESCRGQIRNETQVSCIIRRSYVATNAFQPWQAVLFLLQLSSEPQEPPHPHRVTTCVDLDTTCWHILLLSPPVSLNMALAIIIFYCAYVLFLDVFIGFIFMPYAAILYAAATLCNKYAFHVAAPFALSFHHHWVGCPTHRAL